MRSEGRTPLIVGRCPICDKPLKNETHYCYGGKGLLEKPTWFRVSFPRRARGADEPKGALTKRERLELKAMMTNGWTERERKGWREYLKEEVKPYYPRVYALLTFSRRSGLNSQSIGADRGRPASEVEAELRGLETNRKAYPEMGEWSQLEADTLKWVLGGRKSEAMRLATASRGARGSR